MVCEVARWARRVESSAARAADRRCVLVSRGCWFGVWVVRPREACSAAHLHPQEHVRTYRHSPRSPSPLPPLSRQEAHPPPPRPPPVPSPAAPQHRSARPASRPCSPPASGSAAAPRSTGGSCPSAGRRWATHSQAGRRRRRRRSAAGLLRRSSGSSGSSARGWTAAAAGVVVAVAVVAGARARCGGRRCWRCCRGRSSCSLRGGREARAACQAGVPRVMRAQIGWVSRSWGSAGARIEITLRWLRPARVGVVGARVLCREVFWCRV